MVAWELIQVAVVGRFSSIMVYIVLAVIALAEHLWTTEFSGQQIPLRACANRQVAYVSGTSN